MFAQLPKPAMGIAIMDTEDRVLGEGLCWKADSRRSGRSREGCADGRHIVLRCNALLIWIKECFGPLAHYYKLALLHLARSFHP